MKKPSNFSTSSVLALALVLYLGYQAFNYHYYYSNDRAVDLTVITSNEYNCKTHIDTLVFNNLNEDQARLYMRRDHPELKIETDDSETRFIYSKFNENPNKYTTIVFDYHQGVGFSITF